MKKRVVVTGIGVVAPNGVGIDAFHSACKQGKSGISRIEELDGLNFGCLIGGIPDISSSKYLGALNQYGLNEADDCLRYACIAGLEAWENAKLQIPAHDSQEVDFDTGVIIGTGIGSISLTGNKLVPFVSKGEHRKLRSQTIEHMMISGSSAKLAGMLAAGNLCTANSNACSTGTEAIHLSAEWIRDGKAVRMLAGGSDGYSPYYWAMFDNMRILTREHNDQPEKGSRPMSASARGFVPGAGAGVVLLEELESAKARNAPIYAEVMGGCLNSGGQRNGGTMTSPNPEGVQKCITGALLSSGVAAEDISLISGHLTATKADADEIKNWSISLDRRDGDFPYINSLKSLVGHCLGASGAIETVAALLQMRHDQIFPNLNCEDLHPEILERIDSNRIPTQLVENAGINSVIKASFGFGDTNACLVLKN